MKNKSSGFVIALFIIGSFCISGCSSSQVSSESDANYHNKMGMAYLNEGKLQLAYVEFQKAMQKDPNNKEVLYNLGITSIRLEDYESAKNYFVRTVKLAPDFADAQNNLGATYMQLGQWQLAIDSFRRALANPLYRTPELAYYSLGISLYRLGIYEKALDSFKDSIRRERSFPLPYYGMALVYNKLERYGEAAEALDRAILIDPEYKGNKEKKAADLKDRLYSVKGVEEQDIRDYLEIMQY
jgi:type IV pilus biogenesis/stability protein PilW